MKKQRIIHSIVGPAQIIGALVAWHWLLPYLVHNPGIQLLMGVLILSEIAHFFLHDK